MYTVFIIQITLCKFNKIPLDVLHKSLMRFLQHKIQEILSHFVAIACEFGPKRAAISRCFPGFIYKF